MPETDSFKFKVGFKGDLVANSVDAFDVANTILATSQVLHELADIHFGDNAKQHIQININAFKEGSLWTDFLILAKDVQDGVVPLIPMATEIHKVGGTLLKGYKTLIDVRKLLKGKPPKSVKQVGDSQIEFKAYDNATLTVNYYDMRAVQSKTIQQNFAKIAQPLTKEGSLLREIDVVSEEKDASFIIEKSDAPYLTPIEESQILPEIKYKGTVSKIDTKACSGYLDIGNKRLSFNYPTTLPQEQFLLLVESLKRRIQIYLIGSVSMDYENNPQKMQVTTVESDVKLL
jgi:hypothetical protein